MALFSKLNNVMSTKKLIKKPINEETKIKVTNAVIFDSKVEKLSESINGTKEITAKERSASSIIKNPRKMVELREHLLQIKK